MQYSDAEIFARIRQALVEVFEIDPRKVTLDAHLADDLDIDSIDAVDLIAQLRDLLPRKIEPDEFKRVERIRDVVDLLRDLVNQ